MTFLPYCHYFVEGATPAVGTGAAISAGRAQQRGRHLAERPVGSLQPRPFAAAGTGRAEPHRCGGARGEVAVKFA